LGADRRGQSRRGMAWRGEEKYEGGSMMTHTEKWGDAANRYKNIVAALENLLTQLGPNARSDDFYQRIEAARAVYRHEMVWHRYQNLCCQCRTLHDLGIIKLDDECRNS